ncbi:MAG TPA: sigma-70 family RNA polymerase sigma factor, partial [Clostridiales bacterium]|nr:sigma-70 family RNA polymerase sigma factor [Clostridiales bacterium]
MMENEKKLLAKAKKGDIEAFEKLVENYQKKAFNIAYRMMGDYDDANDMTQEAFIRVYKSIKNFKEQSSFSTWIYRIITNVCLDELRKRKNASVVSIDEDVKLDDSDVKRQIESDGPTPEETAERNELKRLVGDAIKDLSDEHRAVIVLRDLRGFSYEEIAGILKCPEGTVKSRISRARQALKDILKAKRELFY